MPEIDLGASYVLISPAGKLVFRPDGPSQMLAAVTFDGVPPHEFTIIAPSAAGRGLHGAISSIDRPLAPPNPLAAAIVAELGGPVRDRWLGVLGICGTRLAGPGSIEPCGLTAAQRRLVRSIYSSVRARRLISH